VGVRFALLVALMSLASSGPDEPQLGEPATDLARVGLHVQTSGARFDLAIDGATLAATTFTVLNAGPPLMRVIPDGDTLHLTGNTAGLPADLRIEAVLAGVGPAGHVGWTMSPDAAAGATIEVYNDSRGSTLVDRFTIDQSTRRETASDRLRASAPLRVGATGSHLLLAFFYPWYDRDTWSNPQLLDTPLHRYSTDDVDDMVRVLGEVKAAGLDAVAVTWQGLAFDGGWNHRRMMVLLEAARRAGLRACVLLETTVANPEHEQNGIAPDPDTVLQWLQDVVDAYAGHPAYLHVDGRPVVFAYAAQRLTEPRWRDVLARLRAGGREVLLIGEGSNTTRLGAFQGLFYYASNQFAGDAIRGFDRRESLGARTYHLLPGDDGGRRIWVATVSPGYDDTRLTDGRVPRITDRDDGRYYDAQWQAAFEMGADWIAVTSWNEWWENTAIEPSQRDGDKYLRQTRAWTSQFRRAVAAKLARE